MKAIILATLPFALVACKVSDNQESADENKSTSPTLSQSENSENKEPSLSVINVDSVTAATMIGDNPKIIVIDVRTPEEFQQGHIKGAINIDFNASDFAARIAQLDNTRRYVVHCRSGGRSSKALKTFEKSNFKSIFHLHKGFNDWQQSGKPVVTGASD